MGRTITIPIKTINMSEYKCISPTGQFRVGDQISKETYWKLNPMQRTSFTPIPSYYDETKREPDVIDDAIDLLGTAAVISAGMDLFGSDNSSSSDSGSSFDGFDGGSFGGGGASSDW